MSAIQFYSEEAARVRAERDQAIRERDEARRIASRLQRCVDHEDYMAQWNEDLIELLHRHPWLEPADENG